MVKDRLIELKQHGDQNGGSNNKKTSENHTLDIESGPKNLRHTFDRSEVIRQWIEQIEKNNQQIRLLLRKLEDVNHKDTEDKLQSIFQNNTSLAKQTSDKFKEISVELSEQSGGNAETRIKNIQFSTLKKRFEKAFLDNNQLLETYKTTQKQIIKSQLVAKGYFNVSDEEVALLLEDGTDIQLFTDNILAETAEAKRILANVEERHQQLLEIERMLTEVRDLFIQMSILVDTQQDLLDRIEYQAQTTADTIGAVDLNAVRKSKKKYLKRKIIIIVVVIILVLILLVVLLK